MSWQESRVTREQMVGWSVFAFVKAAMEARGFPDGEIVYERSFQPNLFGEEEGVEKTYVAAGYHQDDGGKKIELGSPLRRKTYILEYWVVAPNAVRGEAVKNAIAEAVEAVDVIPLYDYAQSPDPPVIDQLWLDENPAKGRRVAVPDPAPWQENLYLVEVTVTDDYYPNTPLS